MKRMITVLVVLMMLAGACGDDTVTAAPGPVDESVDESLRIVSLSPTATEILFAIGAGDQVIAVDSLSNHPADAPVTDLEGFSPNVEAIAELDPGLVVISFDPGDVVSGLDALGVDTIVQGAAASIDGAYAQIAELGAATSREDDAAGLIAEIGDDLARLVDEAPSGEGLTYYHELDSTLFSVTGATFAGEIYGLFGLENIADPADADGAAFGYPQLTEEFLIDADPDFVFLADTICCGQDSATVAARPGWEEMTAVRNGDVVELSDDVASRWGPRIVEFAAAIAAALDGAA